MSLKPEQIGRDRRIVKLDGKAIKRATSRVRRQEEKRDLEGAPRRRKYKGYAG